MKLEKTGKKSLGESLIESVGESTLKEVALEAADIALDSILDSESLKEIPVFGWFFKVYGAQQSITERLFLQKVCVFLTATSKVSVTKRKQFKNDLDNNPNFRKKVGNNLLLLIDKHERVEKSELLGKIMAKVIEGECSSELFFKIGSALDRSTIEDLEELKKYLHNINGLPVDVQQGLYRSGFMDIDVSGYSFDPIVDISVAYNLNELGEKLIEYALLD